MSNLVQFMHQYEHLHPLLTESDNLIVAYHFSQRGTLHRQQEPHPFEQIQFETQENQNIK